MGKCTPDLGGSLQETQCFLPSFFCVLTSPLIKYFICKSIYSCNKGRPCRKGIPPAALSSGFDDLAFRHTISEGDFHRKPSMTNTKTPKEKGICDYESQSEPTSTLVHTNDSSQQLASPSLDTALQSPFLFSPLPPSGWLIPTQSLARPLPRRSCPPTGVCGVNS